MFYELFGIEKYKKKINKNSKIFENWVIINFDNFFFLVLNYFNDLLI